MPIRRLGPRRPSSFLSDLLSAALVRPLQMHQSFAMTWCNGQKLKVFTQDVLAQISRLVDQGLSSQEIAQRIGCKLSSLTVRCSQYGISLRRRSQRPAASGLHAGDGHETPGGPASPLGSDPHRAKVRRLAGMLSQHSRHGEHDGIRPPATTPQARGSELDIQIELLLPPAIVKELRRHAARRASPKP